MPIDDRYHRQRVLPAIGDHGQARLAAARIFVAGCGALGSFAIDLLARAGVGTLVLVDRDVVEWSNLQRQTLFDESHAHAGTPKAVAAAERVAAINAQVRTVVAVEDLSSSNIARLAAGCDLLLDGLDNFEARYLLNDLAVSRGIPYLYGGAVSTTGMMLTVLPTPGQRRELRSGGGAEGGAGDGARGGASGERLVAWRREEATPCLRCIFPEPPPPGAAATCDTAGVLGAAVATIAALQATQAIKLLVGDVGAVERRLLSIDLWTNEWRFLDVDGDGPHADCPCCALGRFEFLEGRAAGSSAALCGRDAVQVVPSGTGRGQLDLPAAAARLALHGQFAATAHLVRGTFAGERGELGPIELTLFADGRAIVRGTREVERARAIYAKFVGT